MSSEAWDVVGPQPDRGGDRQARAFEASRTVLERTSVAQQDFDRHVAAGPEVPWWEGPRPKNPGGGIMEFAWGEVFGDDSIYLEALPPTGRVPAWWNPERDGMPHRLRIQVIEVPEVPVPDYPRTDDEWAEVPEVVLGEHHTIDWDNGGCVECSEERRARLAFRRVSSHIDFGCGPECTDCAAKDEALGEVDRIRHPEDLSADEVRHLATDAGWGETLLHGQSVLVPPGFEERRADSMYERAVARADEDLWDERTGEVRVVDPETGGAKGSKPARFDMIPADVLWELAEHYGKGEAKYPGDEATGQANWQKGYPWHLSVAALERHLNAWLAGEDVDPETGTNHLIAVAWHAFALRYFQKHGLGRDDIWTRRLAA